MRSQALALADELASATLPVPDKDITDSVELLRWLGRRPLHLPRLPRVPARRRAGRRAGAGRRAWAPAWASCAGTDQPRRGCCPTMSPEAYQAALMEKRLLIITKANSRSTVHRSAYLDYIGFKIFDADGNVVGEKRFLGLFASAAVPDLGPRPAGRQAQGGRGDGALRPVPAQPLRQGSDGDPGGLPARRAVPDQDRRPVRHRDGRAAAGRPPPAAAVRPQGPVRPVHLRAWSTCPGTGSPPPTGCASRRSCCAS